MELHQIGLNEMLRWYRAAPPSPLKGKCVYVLGFEDNKTKIGVTENLGRRMKTLENMGGNKIKKFCYTYYVAPGYAYYLEKKCHKLLKSKRTIGEFFFM